MNSAAYELAQLIDSEGIGTFASDSGWSIAVSQEPAKPDDVITLYDTGGAAPLHYDEEMRQPSIQVRTRSKSYMDAYDKQHEIFQSLNAVIGQVISGTLYSGVWLATDITSIGQDESNRYILTSNYNITRRIP